MPAAFASSVSMCIAGRKFSLTLTTTSPNITERLSELIFTFTICLSIKPYSDALSGFKCMCLLATITPSFKTTSPHGPTNVHPGVPLWSPDSFTGGTRPIFLASVNESST